MVFYVPLSPITDRTGHFQEIQEQNSTPDRRRKCIIIDETTADDG